ncbi:hypothetical protein [Conexibacter sp. CPCC 206217]|uniref:COG4315 family predicted lipoprotein n=1 Tax=Conexibacter sp. CPCC 206217 TaxID=3064574 RepID=UPI0027203472|nr:hypothetical protein [Conexibacter sp. CPCC 206217]MDO8213605.1 hypothetical protein [Conexibacter sp. CPCC 206217]
MRSRLFSRAAPAVALIVAALVVAGCGSSSNDDSGSSGSGSTAASAASGGGAYGGSPSSSSGSSTTTATRSTAGNAAAVVRTARTPLGTILVDATGRTLYLWEADTGMSSTCTGACAQAWPPLTTSGRATADGGATSSDLGTTKRADGTTQVTYAGHPLYYFSGDSGAGQTNGQDSDGFGADWFVVMPSGKAIEGGGS